MIQIPLTQGKVALADDQDAELLKKYKWFAIKNKRTFYAATKLNYKMISMHRMLLGVQDKKILVDHVDGNGLNNSRTNIRIANHSQNSANRRKRDNATSKFLGVMYEKRTNKWFASVKKDGKAYLSPRLKTELEAAIEYNKLATFHHGDFARLNQLPLQPLNTHNP